MENKILQNPYVSILIKKVVKVWAFILKHSARHWFLIELQVAAAVDTTILCL
jgi:hypothetical protein